jgi:hypothetical protein
MDGKGEVRGIEADRVEEMWASRRKTSRRTAAHHPLPQVRLRWFDLLCRFRWCSRIGSWSFLLLWALGWALPGGVAGVLSYGLSGLT